MHHRHPLLSLGLLWAAFTGTVHAAAAAPTLTQGDVRLGQHSPRPVDLHVEAFAPSVRLTVLPDPAAGWNVLAEVENFQFAPKSAGGRQRSGEGHAQLYVDGLKVARVYGPAFHLPSLSPGKHVVTLSLNANDHAPYLRRGQPIDDSVEVVVPDPPCGEHADSGTVAAHDHSEMHGPPKPKTQQESPAIERPTVRLTFVRDSHSGWNLLADVTRFRFAPEHASLEPQLGEGHAHLWVDGKKLARVYGPAFHIPTLAPGTHSVTYSLHGNDHAAIGVEASVEVRVD